MWDLKKVRVEEEGAKVRGVEVDGASDPLALDLRVPRKVTEGSSRFQQFFLI